MSSMRFPKQIKFIIGNEACERFSYYGIRSILALYISQVLFSHLLPGKAMDEATELIHLFVFANYITALLGGWLSDKVLGRYNTILYVSLIYCLGNLMLALGTGTLWGLYIGLGLIALGSGGIKPCVSAFCGDQFKPEQSAMLEKAYGLFYWSINFGSFFSFLVIPWVKGKWGYQLAFGIPGVLMLVATLVFWLGRKSYVCFPPARETKTAGFFKVLSYCLTHRRSAGDFWGVAHEKFSEKEIAAARSVVPILTVFAPTIIFWSLFDQTSSTWVIQGEKMVAYPLSWSLSLFGHDLSGGLTLGAEQMQSMNALLVMLLVPLTLWLYPRVTKLGVKVTSLRRIGTGMVLAALAYVIVALIQTRVDAGAHLSVLWQTLPYVVLTAAEVLISTTGLEFAFTQASVEMKSTITSFWLACIALGNLLVPVITKIQSHLLTSTGGAGESAAVNASTFYLYAGMTFVVALGFMVVAMGYKERRLEMTSEVVVGK